MTDYIKLSEFYNSDFVNYSSYDNLRKISQIDGLKNASRKIIYTLLEKNVKNFVKVSQLGAMICQFSDYLHGNLDNVVVTLGQNYAGTNNVPLIEKKGNFGTRFSNDASAARYIFAKGSDELFKLFKKEDTAILVNQYFEGYKIEPQFYVPTLPVLLLNGSEGISSGFAQKILPRDPKKIKKYILDKLSGKNPRGDFTPAFNGFSGTVKQGETPNQWLIEGVVEKIAKNKVLIKEVPIGYDLKSYLKTLDSLEDDKKIVSYKDLSDDDVFKFEVTFLTKDLEQLSDDDILERLKLIKKVSENYTILDENNKIKEFNNAKEICDYYINFKLSYVQKRKDYLIEKYNSDLDILKSKIAFIKGVTQNEIIISKKKKDEIVKQLEKTQGIIKVNDSFDYLLKLPLYSLTAEKILELEKQLKETKDSLKELKETTSEILWTKDIDEL